MNISTFEEMKNFLLTEVIYFRNKNEFPKETTQVWVNFVEFVMNQVYLNHLSAVVDIDESGTQFIEGHETLQEELESFLEWASKQELRYNSKLTPVEEELITSSNIREFIKTALDGLRNY
jgi:hypothetical protein